MMVKLGQLWRLFATAFCFTTFAVGGLIGLTTLWPLLTLALFWNPDKRHQLGKRIVQTWFRIFVEIMRFSGVLTYDIRNRDLLSQSGQLILANHPSLIDVVFLIAFTKNADCVVKNSLLRNPFALGPISMAGYISNSDPNDVLETAAASLHRGNNLIIFPEGTRTTAGAPLSLKRGAANIALRSEAVIRPVIIKAHPAILTKDSKWYHIPPEKFQIVIDVKPVISTTDLVDETQPVTSRRFTAGLQQYFTTELALTTADVNA